MLKQCSKCRLEKPLEEFYKQAAGKHGHTSRCIPCCSQDHKDYKARLTPPSVKEARSRKQSLFARGLKECLGCKEVKPFDEFFRVNDRRVPRCKECSMAAHRAWKGKNKQHMLEYVRDYTSRDDVSAKRRDNRLKRIASSPRHVIMITLRHGLFRRQTENPATIDDMMRMWEEQGGCCAVTGIQMTWGKGRVLPTSISLDRIDPEGGYSADNLRLICHAVNAFKGRMSDDEMYVMAYQIVQNMRKPKLRLVS